jgi:hypothetical protein
LARIAPEDWGSLRLTLHPSLGLVTSPYAVASIWQAHRGGPALGTFSIDAPQSIIVVRPAASVDIHIVSPASFTFVSALSRGLALADAVDHVASAHPDFDINNQIAGLFGLGLIAGYST